MSRFMLMSLAGAIAALLGVAPCAGAASRWTTPQSFAGTTVEVAPRAAIAADGTSAVTWPTRKRTLVVSTGLPDGRFRAPRVISRRPAEDYSVAAARGGAFVVAWCDAHGVAVAVRTATGRRLVVRRIIASTTISTIQVAADPRGGWVIVGRGRSSTSGPWVRALSLDSAGRRAGPPQVLAPGDFGADARQTQALAIDRDGRAVLTFTRTAPNSFGEGTVQVTTRPHGGIFGQPVTVPGIAAEPRVTVAGRAAITVVRRDRCAEAGCFGSPGVTLLDAAGTPASPFGPSLARPQRAFAPTATLTTPARGVLVFQLKTKPTPFSREAPVQAVAFTATGNVGALQTLTPVAATEPVVLALSGARAIALWATRHAIGAALAGPDGRFHDTPAPSGPPPSAGHINATNRDLRTAGRYAIFAWEGNGHTRISIRRF